MARSELGNYVHDALISAKNHLNEGDLGAVERDRQTLKRRLESLPQGSYGVESHLMAINWGPWTNLRELQDYELFHDSNRPAGDPREGWIIK